MSKTKGAKEKFPACLATREIIFTNLLLLGFEPGAMESKYNIPFTKDMFTLPNKKAFEVVMHFLFCKLNPVMASEKFRVCWPITDKKQEQLFRKTVANWLLDISKEDPDAHLPRIVPSLFLSPGGAKFYTVLLYFTQLVIYKAITGENGEKEREILRKPQLAPGVSPLSNIIVKTYQAATIRRQKQALEQTQVTLLVHRQWQQFTSELVKDYRALSKSVRELDRKVKDLYAESFDLAQARGEAVSSRRRSGVRSEGEKEVLAVKRAQKLQKVRELWKVVDNLMVSQAPEREVVESILQEVAMKSKLDAEDIHVQVPELLLRECEAEIQRRNIANVYQGGKLSLLSLIQLWNLALQLYLEKIQQAPIASFDSIAPSVVTQVHTHHAHLSNAQALRSSLSKEIVPELKASVDRLKRETSMRRTPGRSRASLRTFHSTTLGLGLLPATPPVSFEPACDSDSTPVSLRTSTVKQSHLTMDTPEAVSRMSQAVDRTALKTSGLVQGTPSSMLGDLRQQIHGRQSKLPMPTDSTTSLTNRKRVKSAPSKVTSTVPESSHSRPRPTPSQSHRKQVKKLSRTRTRHDEEGQTKTEWQVKGGMKRGESGSRRLDRTAIVRQTNNNASGTAHKARTKATPKAHQILADQIADAVMSGVGVLDGFSPQLSSSLPQESPPIVAALKDPLSALDQSAFVSKDKLSRTPTQMDDTTASAVNRGMPLQQATRTLFTDNAERKQKETSLSLSNQHDQPRLPGRTEDDVRLRVTPNSDVQRPHQEVDVSISNLMDFSSTSLFPQDPVLSDNSSDDILQWKDNVHTTMQGDDGLPSLPKSHQIDRTDRFGLSPASDNHRIDPQHLHRSHTPSSSLLEDSESGVHRTAHTPTSLPLEDLEQTLLEITRTKTPQLPFRSRQRVNQRVTSPIKEDPEDDLITSTRSSLSPVMNTSFANLLAHNESNHTPSPLDTNTRTDYNMKLDEISQKRTENNVSSELHRLEASVGNQEREYSKNRQTSSGSQKSVTFSDHIDEHSFQNLQSPSAGHLEEAEKEHSDDGDLDIIDVHSSQAYGLDYMTSDSPEVNLVLRDSSPNGNDNAFISETYLRRSPQSKVGEESSQSPLESALQSELDLSGAFSPDPSKRMQLLEHISPLITPSKTPKLVTRKGALYQSHLVSSQAFGERNLQEHNLSSGYGGTHMGLGSDVSLVKGLSDLRLSGSLRRSGKANAEETLQKMVHHTPKAMLEFSGLFDEDDSILLSGSPLSKSIHDDGMDHLNPMAVTSPPVHNLIDI